MSRPDQNQAMHEYLDALLFEEESLDEEGLAEKSLAEKSVPELASVDEKTQRLERLLANATVLAQENSVTEPVPVQPSTAVQQQQAEEAALAAEFARAAELEAKLDAQQKAQQKAQQVAEPLTAVSPPPLTDTMQPYQERDFQALFFSVAGLKLAVPLNSLGGIHQWKEPNTIFGKPKWYLGILTNREEKLNVVDTALWVMPEKYTPEMAEALDYKYLITLGESQWGLACESLVTTETLSPLDIQWRKSNNAKRPWLAGVVRDKMCAILDVDALTQMLEQGLNSQD